MKSKKKILLPQELWKKKLRLKTVNQMCPVEKVSLKFHKIHRKTNVPQSLFYQKRLLWRTAFKNSFFMENIRRGYF